MLCVTATDTSLLSTAEPFSWCLYPAHVPVPPYWAHMRLLIQGVWTWYSHPTKTHQQETYYYLSIGFQLIIKETWALLTFLKKCHRASHNFTGVRPCILKKEMVFVEQWNPSNYLLTGGRICLEDCRTFKVVSYFNILKIKLLKFLLNSVFYE